MRGVLRKLTRRALDDGLAVPQVGATYQRVLRCKTLRMILACVTILCAGEHESGTRLRERRGALMVGSSDSPPSALSKRFLVRGTHASTRYGNDGHRVPYHAPRAGGARHHPPRRWGSGSARTGT